MVKKLLLKDFVGEEDNFYLADLVLSPGEYSSPHQHDFYEFFVVLQGAFREICNQKSNLFQKMQVHVLRPEDCHQLIFVNSGETNLLRNIAVRRDLFEHTVNRSGIQNTDALFEGFTLHSHIFSSFCEKTKRIMSLSCQNSTKKYLFESILQDLIFCGLIEKQNTPSIPSWLRACYQKMQEGDLCVEGLPTLIALSGKSQEHLTREFHRYYGITPTDFINQLRLQRAASKLVSSHSKITEIVCESGFHNLSYFNRLFRKHYGMTPAEFRQKNKAIFLLSGQKASRPVK